MAEQGKTSRAAGEGATAAKAVLEPLELSEEQSARVLRQFDRAQRIADLADNRDRMNRTRSTLNRLAASTMSLELSAIDQEVAEEMASGVSTSLALERTIPMTDLFLAIEFAARSMRDKLFAPGRPTNVSLHLIVETLLPALESACLEPVRIRWNKTNDRQPEAANPPMAALLDLARLILPETTDISVFNIIRKIHSAKRVGHPMHSKEQ